MTLYEWLMRNLPYDEKSQQGVFYCAGYWDNGTQVIYKGTKPESMGFNRFRDVAIFDRQTGEISAPCGLFKPFMMETLASYSPIPDTPASVIRGDQFISDFLIKRDMKRAIKHRDSMKNPLFKHIVENNLVSPFHVCMSSYRLDNNTKIVVQPTSVFNNVRNEDAYKIMITEPDTDLQRYGGQWVTYNKSSGNYTGMRLMKYVSLQELAGVEEYLFCNEFGALNAKQLKTSISDRRLWEDLLKFMELAGNKALLPKGL